MCSTTVNTKTIAAIESAIKQLNLNQSSNNLISFDLTQVTLLLHFVEYLEKLASEGIASDSLHSVQKNVKIFLNNRS